MIGIVVAAHGNLAEALLTTAKTVLPQTGPVEAVGIADHDDAAAYEDRLQAAIERVQQGAGVLVLTDMFGGTPSNIGLAMHQAGRVEVLTGANLPMLIKAMQLCAEQSSLAATAIKVKEYGHRAIAVASEVLGEKETAGE